jgi:hypothetical protein
MGFFSAKVTCAVCGKETGLNRYQLANKEWICRECFKACGYTWATPIRLVTSEQAKIQVGIQAEQQDVSTALIPTTNFCKKCGNKIEKGSVFCSKCGINLNVNTNNEKKVVDQKENDIKVKNSTKTLEDNKKFSSPQYDSKAPNKKAKKLTKKQKTLIIILIIVPIIIIFGIINATESSNETIEYIKLEDNLDEELGFDLLGFGNTYKGYFTINTNNYDVDDLEIVTDVEGCVSALITRSYATKRMPYKITALYNGEVNVYIQTKDGSIRSETKKFIVSGGKHNPYIQYFINEPVVFNDITFEVVSYEITQAIPSTMGSPITTEDYFLYLQIKIKNTSANDYNCYTSNFKIETSEGLTYTSKDYMFMQNHMKNYKLGPKFERTFNLVYEIPNDEDDLSYKLIIESANDKIKIFLKDKDI